MSVYKVEFERWVWRRVDLRQTCVVYIKADNREQAKEAAIDLGIDDEIEDYIEKWEDDNLSRQASDDHHEGYEGRTRLSSDPLETRNLPRYVRRIADARTLLNLPTPDETDS